MVRSVMKWAVKFESKFIFIVASLLFLATCARARQPLTYVRQANAVGGVGPDGVVEVVTPGARGEKVDLMPSTPDGICTYELPAEFNVELMESSFGIAEPHPRPLALPQSSGGSTRGLYDTCGFCLERVFYDRMQSISTERRHPSECIAFYVPYFVAWETSDMHGVFKQRITPKLDAAMLTHLVHMGRRPGPRGHDHIIVSGRISKDVSHFLDLPEVANMIKLAPENTKPGRWNNLVAVPYPSWFQYSPDLEDDSNHLGPCWLWGDCRKPLGNERTTPLISFVGHAQARLDIDDLQRKRIVGECEAQPTHCTVFETGPRKNSAGSIQAMIPVVNQLYSSSVFCLQPTGDTPTRKGIFDSLVAGCIPVIFTENTLRHYFWHLPEWESVSILYPKQKRGEGVIDYLVSLAVERPEFVLAKLANVSRVAYSQQYSVHPAPREKRGMDAFQIALEKALRLSQIGVAQ